MSVLVHVHSDVRRAEVLIKGFSGMSPLTGSCFIYFDISWLPAAPLGLLYKPLR